MHIVHKKLRKLYNNPKLFILDALDNRAHSSAYARKTKKFIESPSRFITDYLNKRPKLKKGLEAYSKNVPFAQYHYVLYKHYKKNKFNAKAEEEIRRALEIKQRAEYFYHLGMHLKRKKQWWQSTEAFKKAIELSKNPPTIWYKEYAFVLTQMNKFKEASIAWKNGLRNNKNSNDWFSYGHVLKLSGEPEKAEMAFSKAIEYDKEKNAKEFGIGIFYEKKGDWVHAKEEYEATVNENPLNARLRYRYALSLDRNYEWERSEEEYTNAIYLNPDNPDWYYRLGFVRERQGKYKEAAEAYAYAAKNRKTHTPYWYYRLGYVLEKLNKHEEACEAFVAMKNLKLLNIKTHNTVENDEKQTKKDMFINEKSLLALLLDNDMSNNEILKEIKQYVDDEKIENKIIELMLKNDKAGIYSLLLKEKEKAEKEREKAEKERKKAEKEISLIESVLKNDTTRVDLWHKIAKAYTTVENYARAEYAYKRLIERKNDFEPNAFFELGYILALQGKYKEASRAFIEQRIMQSPFGWIETPYSKDKKLRKIIDYTEFYERNEIDNKTILYESYHGRSISCNPYAIFKEVYKDERFQRYKHVWAINNFDIIPEELKSYENIIFVKRESDLYLRYLTTAKYLINNTSFSDYFIRKSQQKYLNTWHGTPIKLMGKYAKDELLSYKNIVRNFLHTTHLIHPNQYTQETMTDSYGISDIYSGMIAETGYPRQDIMLNMKDKDKRNLINKLAINCDKKIILYAPTWRGKSVSDIEFDSEKLAEDLKMLSRIENAQVLYRGHYMAERFIKDDAAISGIKVVPSTIDTNRLLSIVDILITDYSSIAFDFMALKKPIIYYIYDKDKYINERGLNFDLEEISENICTSSEELLELVNKLVLNPMLDKKQDKDIKKLIVHDDGKASKRVIEFFFFNKTDNVKLVKHKKKETILIYSGPFIPNGITTSIINLVSQIDKNKFDINIVLEPNTIINNEQRLEQLNRIDEDVKLLARFGRMNITLEEKWIIDKLNSQKDLASKEMWNFVFKAYSREFFRVFGYGEFDHIINFEGYNAFWIRLFSSIDKANNSLYLHNDMLGEAQTRFPSLYLNFYFYEYYNNLISASIDAHHTNKENLSELYSIPMKKFKHCDNLLNPREVLLKANESLESPADEKYFTNARVFINMARLSPEKDQEKLIKAFSKVVKKHENTRLLIIGQGPLKHHLEGLIKKLHLQKHVFLLGQKFNPMPYLKRMDCFVLSSNYEGQGLVLLESMILGKPVISTDIVGPRSVLQNGVGLLVENSEEGLVRGMFDYLEGRYNNTRKFDYEEYNRRALNDFYEKVLGKKFSKSTQSFSL